MQMRHKVPTPLKNRVFTVIVAAGQIENEFVDVQIPVELPSDAKYKEGNTEIVHGVYASVERGSVEDRNSNLLFHLRWKPGEKVYKPSECSWDCASAFRSFSTSCATFSYDIGGQ